MNGKLSEIISWRINNHHGRIWIKNDHTGYVLFVDRINYGNFSNLKEAQERMHELLGVKI